MSATSKLKVVQDVVSSIFQLDRLEELARKNSLVQIAYAEWIMLSNYVILTMNKTIVLENFEIMGVVITGKEFEPDLEGKLNALALCFAHCAGKLDMALSVDNFRNAMVGVGQISDIAKAVLSAGSTQQIQGVPGYSVKMKPTFKKEK